MSQFFLNDAAMNKLSVFNEFVVANEQERIHEYCPGCSSSGCTGSAQYGCDSCSSCSSWAG